MEESAVYIILHRKAHRRSSRQFPVRPADLTVADGNAQCGGEYMDVEIVESRVVELGAKGDCRKPLGLDGTPWGSDDGRVVEVQAPRRR